MFHKEIYFKQSFIYLLYILREGSFSPHYLKMFLRKNNIKNYYVDHNSRRKLRILENISLVELVRIAVAAKWHDIRITPISYQVIFNSQFTTNHFVTSRAVPFL